MLLWISYARTCVNSGSELSDLSLSTSIFSPSSIIIQIDRHTPAPRCPATLWSTRAFVYAALISCARYIPESSLMCIRKRSHSPDVHVERIHIKCVGRAICKGRIQDWFLQLFSPGARALENNNKSAFFCSSLIFSWCTTAAVVSSCRMMNV